MVPVIRESLKLEFPIQLGHYAQLNTTSENSRIKDYQSKLGQEAKKKKEIERNWYINIEYVFFFLMSLP